jgi:hypothetical protein
MAMFGNGAGIGMRRALSLPQTILMVQRMANTASIAGAVYIYTRNIAGPLTVRS